MDTCAFLVKRLSSLAEPGETVYNEKMSKRVVLFLSGVGVLLLFVLFSYLVHENLFTQLDFNTTVRLQDNISRRFDPYFSFLSDIGKFEVMTIVLIAIFAITRKWIAGAVALVMFAGFHFIEIFGKFFVDHPPPPQFMLRTEQVLNFPQFHVRSENSYPSGHEGRAVFLAVLLAILIITSKRFSMPVKAVLLGFLAGYVLIMGVSRAYLGEHWTSDVIGGGILGAACALMAGSMLVPHTKEHTHHEFHEHHKKGLFSRYKIEIKKVA